MTNIVVHFNHQDYPNNKLNQSIASILDANFLFSMSSIKDRNESWINTAYYAYSPTLNFYYLSSRGVQHSKNIETNSSVALAIFNSSQFPPTGGKSGLQIFGNCKLAVGEEISEGLQLYSAKYEWMKSVIKTPEDFDKNIIQSKLYIIKTKVIKIFDEPTFGEEKWITLAINP